MLWDACPEFLSGNPIQKKQNADEKQGAGYAQIYRPMKPSPEHNQIQRPQSGEQDSSHPFPAPGDGQYDKNDSRWDKMYQQGQNCFPESVARTKHVSSKSADERGKEKAQDSRCPEQQLF